MSKTPRNPNVNPELPEIPGPEGPWKCRSCRFYPMAQNDKNCFVCGRDFWGAPGTIPEKPSRAYPGRGFEELEEEVDESGGAEF